MADLSDFQSEPGTGTTLRDRRRPGRREFVNLGLIQLLRGELPTIPGNLAETSEPADLSHDRGHKPTPSAARGISLGVALGSLIWASIGVSFWLWFRA